MNWLYGWKERRKAFPCHALPERGTYTSSVVTGPPGTSLKTLLNLLVNESVCPPQAQLAYPALILTPFYQARSQNCEKRLLISSVRLSAYLSVRMEQLGSHWTFFDEILYLRTFRKSVEFQVLFQSNKNSRYFAWRPMYLFNYDTSLSSSESEKWFGKSCTEETHILRWIILFPKIDPFMR